MFTLFTSSFELITKELNLESLSLINAFKVFSISSFVVVFKFFFSCNFASNSFFFSKTIIKTNEEKKSYSENLSRFHSFFKDFLFIYFFENFNDFFFSNLNAEYIKNFLYNILYEIIMTKKLVKPLKLKKNNQQKNFELKQGLNIF